MAVLIKEVLDIPDQVHQGDFVVDLARGVMDPQATVDNYVVTPQLQGCFDEALTFIRSALDARASKPAYLHGSFGAGKSHFMAVLYLLLQGDPHARLVPQLTPIADKHRWLEDKKFLLVPYHMIGAHSMESAILGGYVKFVRERHPDKEIPAVYIAEDIFMAARRRRTEMGDEAFYQTLSQGRASSGWGKMAAGWTSDRFEAAMAAEPTSAERQRLVSDVVKYVCPEYERLVAAAGEGFISFDDGLAVISQHAASLGYQGLILFLDEMILWLASRAADLAFIQREGQKLAKLMESQNPKRPIPIISFVARQRDLRDLVGTHVSGAEQLNFSDALKHWEGRFHTITLEDRNLPEVAEKRVLRAKSPVARIEMDKAFEETEKIRKEIMDILLTSKSDRSTFRKVYPFSPALVETLVALSSLLQRERTALKIMVQLLVDQRDTLELGQIIPVGDLFDRIVHGEEAFTEAMRLNFERARKLYGQRLLPLLEEKYGLARDADPATLDDEGKVRFRNFRNDDRLVKTLILSALAPEVESLKNLTALKLAALNHGTIKAHVSGKEATIVSNRVQEWASHVGEVHVDGDRISLQLSAVDTEGIMARAQTQDKPGNRKLKLRELLHESLGVAHSDQFLLSHHMPWRGTSRTFDLTFANVAELSTDSLKSRDDVWKLIIGYPFDSKDNPRDALARVHQYQNGEEEPTRTVVWIPSFLSLNAQTELGKLVVLDYVLNPDR
ncbi:MAG: DUF6079 family protein, partial [Candidatus Xenobia bacterium]